jgi:hypothetical protein
MCRQRVSRERRLLHQCNRQPPACQQRRKRRASAPRAHHDNVEFPTHWILPYLIGIAATTPERCKVVSWRPILTEQDITVSCNTSNGTPVDTKFTLTYARDGNVLGEPVCCFPDGNPTAYAWADQPTAASYTPNPLYQFTGFAQQITISRLATGSYAVQGLDFLNDGNVQVTAYGNNSAQCKVNFWSPAAGIRVLCFRSGSPIDTRFDVSFVGPFTVG